MAREPDLYHYTIPGQKRQLEVAPGLWPVLPRKSAHAARRPHRYHRARHGRFFPKVVESIAHLPRTVKASDAQDAGTF